ncbi:uncharacterized protein FTJAE_4552 [Fusarium tjaetaba]|uniref:2EXR domain-containing protein n=1 Tax=Fusarium tjaetaba TaxID=1567544 RepID=A0A8H5VYB1_9HYPO|nr:uncharacterized protein FTJAE_4552 [Fusarium tjaetaba]KAF5640006.1 hypothetical protein FTJAE_4552 [Fusarium tjaetaba]
MANFSDLPREIRDIIWALVLRDNHPDVHIFGHRDEDKKGMAEGRSLMHGNLFSGILLEPSPDKYFANLDKDRKNENMSTYLIDGAMWNTCKESRLAIQKHFSHYQWSGDEWWLYAQRSSRVWAEHPWNKVFRMPSTGYFEGGSLNYLTVFPRRDLFVFQPVKLDGVIQYSFGSRQTKGAKQPVFQRLQHIAVEYDPEWWDLLHSSDVPAIIQLIGNALELKNIQKLWIIDHNLKRKKNAPAFDEKGDHWASLNAFYARDRKFLEIDWLNYSGALDDWEFVKPGRDTPNKYGDASVCLVRYLNDVIHNSRTSSGYRHCRVQHHPHYCEIGLLGWDEL